MLKLDFNRRRIMEERNTVKKTYKLFIGGKFPRSESGRTYRLVNGEGDVICNVSQASKKDFRNAVVAARAAVAGWEGTAAFLKSQIIYRIAEMLESRFVQFVQELTAEGVSPEEAAREVKEAIDLVVHYAGWADKYQALFSTVNPVSSPHFSFSTLEPTGVVSIAAPEESSLLGILSAVLPVIVGGNTCVVLASNMMPVSAITLAEVLATSDVPAGVVNILTGVRSELLPSMASHMDVNALLVCSVEFEERKLARELAADNLKHVVLRDDDAIRQSPYHILDFQEVKTTWHPIGV